MQLNNQLDPAWRSTAGTTWDETGSNTSIGRSTYRELMNAGLTRAIGIAADDINNTIRSLILLMIAAAVVIIYASIRLSSGLVTPLTSLASSSIRQVGEGHLNQTVPVVSNDELARSLFPSTRWPPNFGNTRPTLPRSCCG